MIEYERIIGELAAEKIRLKVEVDQLRHEVQRQCACIKGLQEEALMLRGMLACHQEKTREDQSV